MSDERIEPTTPLVGRKFDVRCEKCGHVNHMFVSETPPDKTK